MTKQDHEAAISRAKTCLENATDPQDKREWQEKFLAAIAARNAERTPDQVEQIEHSKGLR